MTHPHREFHTIPLAYHVTFRCYGTWLHGDPRGSVDRFHNRYGTPLIPPNTQWKQYNQRSLKHPPVALQAQRRAAVKEGIRENLQNSPMVFVGAQRQNKPRSYSGLSELRSGNRANSSEGKCHAKDEGSGLWNSSKTPWAKRGSKKRLWTEEQLNRAIAYVEYEQGEPLE